MSNQDIVMWVSGHVGRDLDRVSGLRVAQVQGDANIGGTTDVGRQVDQ
jgi:hypothetical protein